MKLRRVVKAALALFIAFVTLGTVAFLAMKGRVDDATKLFGILGPVNALVMKDYFSDREDHPGQGQQ